MLFAVSYIELKLVLARVMLFVSRGRLFDECCQSVQQCNRPGSRVWTDQSKLVLCTKAILSARSSKACPMQAVSYLNLPSMFEGLKKRLRFLFYTAMTTAHPYDLAPYPAKYYHIPA